MLTERELVTTFEMVKNEHLDVRTVTLGINLFDCASDDCARFRTKIYDRIASLAAPLVETCTRIGDRYGIPVVNKRISVSLISLMFMPRVRFLTISSRFSYWFWLEMAIWP